MHRVDHWTASWILKYTSKCIVSLHSINMTEEKTDTTDIQDDPIAYLPITSVKTLSNCQSLDVCSGKTVFIASYPKSGTTWMQACVYALLTGGSGALSHISDYSPFYEADGTWDESGAVNACYSSNHDSLNCRIFNTHLRWDLMPKGDGAVYIYVYRNGKDVVTSFFHHLSNQADSGGFEGSFDDFFSDWIHNRIVFGGWAKHLKNWISAASDSRNRILLIRYEDMKYDLLGALCRVARHIGCTYSSDDISEKIIPKVSLDYMKSNREKFEPVSVGWKPGFEFIRKGEIGDSKNLFTTAHNDVFDAMLEKEFPAGLPDWVRHVE